MNAASLLRTAACAGLLLLSPAVLFADEAPASPQSAETAAPASVGFQLYQPDLKKGEHCVIEISLLHPTQTSVGYYEVALKGEKLKGKSAKKLQKYLNDEDHVAPIVIGPGGVPYITDHHHMARALWETKLSATVHALILENWSSVAPDEFWKKMQNHVDENGKPFPMVYLDDEKGAPLSSPEALPKTIGEMKDDPFRSLIYVLIEAGVLQKDNAFYSEFTEATYYRQAFKEAGVELVNTKESFDQAVAKAKTLPLPPKDPNAPIHQGAATSAPSASAASASTNPASTTAPGTSTPAATPRVARTPAASTASAGGDSTDHTPFEAVGFVVFVGLAGALVVARQRRKLQS